MPSDVIPGKKITLKPDAYPKIFDSTNSSFCHADLDVDSDVAASTSCEINKEEFDLLKNKVTELQKSIETMNMQHNIEVQRLQQKISSLQHKSKDKAHELKMVKKNVAKEKNESAKLREVISELRQNKYISPDDEKFFNVRKIYLMDFLINLSK